MSCSSYLVLITRRVERAVMVVNGNGVITDGLVAKFVLVFGNKAD